MSEKEVDFNTIAQEALSTQEAFLKLSDAEQTFLVSEVGEIFESLQKRFIGSWNRLRWDELNNRIIEFGSFDPLPEVAGRNRSLSERVKEYNLSPKQASEFIRLSLRNSLFMLQLGVTTMDELKKLREKHRENASPGAGKGIAPKRRGWRNRKYV